MKKLLMTAAALAALTVSAQAEKVTLQLKWVTQAQFAGYYVAQEKGFYKDAGLEVTIKAGGPDINPEQVLAGGGADVIIDWMPSALASREKGATAVNIAQPFKRSGLLLACRKETGITKPEDFKGKTIGVWFGGNEFPLLSWLSQLKLPTTGGADGVTLMKQGFNVDPFLQKQADCISVMSYNEYHQILEAGVKADDVVVFNYTDFKVNNLEDGLYVSADKLKDPAFVATMAKFVKASMKGFDEMRKDPKGSVAAVLKNDASGSQTEAHQASMVDEVNKLTEGSDGMLDTAAADQTVANLMQGDTPVITKKPEGAWTDVVMKAVMALK